MMADSATRSAARLILSGLTGLLLAACTRPTIAGGSGGDLAASPSPPLTATPTPAALQGHERLGGAVVVYERSGGFAGISEMWTIYPDGRISSIDGAVHTVPSEQVERLVAEIESLGFFELQGSTRLPGQCADCIHHRLTVGYSASFNSVVITDGIAPPDDVRRQAIQRVSEFLTQALSQDGNS